MSLTDSEKRRSRGSVRSRDSSIIEPPKPVNGSRTSLNSASHRRTPTPSSSVNGNQFVLPVRGPRSEGRTGSIKRDLSPLIPQTPPLEGYRSPSIPSPLDRSRSRSVTSAGTNRSSVRGNPRDFTMEQQPPIEEEQPGFDDNNFFDDNELEAGGTHDRGLGDASIASSGTNGERHRRRRRRKSTHTSTTTGGDVKVTFGIAKSKNHMFGHVIEAVVKANGGSEKTTNSTSTKPKKDSSHRRTKSRDQSIVE